MSDKSNNATAAVDVGKAPPTANDQMHVFSDPLTFNEAERVGDFIVGKVYFKLGWNFQTFLIISK